MTAPETDRRRQRSDRRRRDLVGAGVEIVNTSGMAGLTHREVAARAGASLGLIRYHFETRGNLALAVLQELEDRRHGAAQHAIDEARPRRSASTAAALFLQAYYGPGLSNHEMIATLGWLVDSARDPVLSAFLRGQRPVIDHDLTTLLHELGRSSTHVGMLRQVVDGAVIAGAAEGVPDLEQHVLKAIETALSFLA